jgi:hypothetical protein
VESRGEVTESAAIHEGDAVPLRLGVVRLGAERAGRSPDMARKGARSTDGDFSEGATSIA